jgi:ABC-2 type transport system permease protein
MHTLLTLVRKDMANFLRNRTAVVLTFVVPIALIYVFGYVWGLNRKPGNNGPQGVRLAVVNASDNPAARKLVDTLKADKAFRIVDTIDVPDGTKRPLSEADARALIHDNKLRFALVLPADLVSENGFGLNLKILSNPQNTIEAQMTEGLLQKTIFSNVPQLLGQSLQARAKGFLGPQRHDQFNRALASAIAGAFGGSADDVVRQIESGDFGFSQLTRPTQNLRKTAPEPTRPAAA